MKSKELTTIRREIKRMARRCEKLSVKFDDADNGAVSNDLDGASSALDMAIYNIDYHRTDTNKAA